VPQVLVRINPKVVVGVTFVRYHKPKSGSEEDLCATAPTLHLHIGSSCRKETP
jgi:hypothetical protein